MEKTKSAKSIFITKEQFENIAHKVCAKDIHATREKSGDLDPMLLLLLLANSAKISSDLTKALFGEEEGEE